MCKETSALMVKTWAALARVFSDSAQCRSYSVTSKMFVTWRQETITAFGFQQQLQFQ
jgi:hypothetical protein